MIVPLYKASSRIHGYGAFASKSIKKGEAIAVWDGPYADKLPDDESARYYLQVPSGRWLIGFGGDNAESFINHSTAPNAQVIWHDDVATLVAVRNIEPNEEVTFDYTPDWKVLKFRKGEHGCYACHAALAVQDGLCEDCYCDVTRIVWLNSFDGYEFLRRQREAIVST